ncbi:Aste57867_20517 [Aphanomyces stellatus]|uniref:Aste57867_20517 protein n=1 Tax=Aphanomyces stellatus TaxID=120398 RepID=A0A485LH62_9STRA|nr:hypothetical protein As57867_020450 [Aphanomyces stellatus]VFT97202.1 Aste57867_20517 [Aphanomyces stellatus]
MAAPYKSDMGLQPQKQGIMLFPPDSLHRFQTSDLDVASSVADSSILHDEYAIILDEGALVPGGALNLWSTEAFGLYAQYAAVGIIYTVIPSLSYPVFNTYLGLEGYQVKSYRFLVNMPWSFKIFFGMLSDCFPILGYRRKPWMFVGWTICLIACVCMALLPFGRPYCVPPADNHLVPTKNGEMQTITEVCRNGGWKYVKPYLDPSVQDKATTFVLLSALATFGYVMADCASDAMVVQYAQREPVAMRGRVQTAIYTVRSGVGILAQLLTGVGLSSPRYGGTFSFDVSVNVVYATLCVPALLACVTTLYWLKEYPTERVPFRKWLSGLWGLLQKQAVWQIMAFRFLSNIFQGFGSTAGPSLTRNWVQMEPVVDLTTSALFTILYTAILAVVGKYGLGWNWRWTIAITTVALVLVDATVYMCTIWDVVRNQWFFTGVILADTIPSGIRFIVSAFCAVELADLGNEGAVYGLITTVNNLATPVAGIFYKWVDSYFKVNVDDIISDTTAVRWDVTYTYVLSYGMKCASLAWLFLLPPQKAHLQRLKRHGIVSPVAGGLAISLFGCFLVFSVVTNILSIFDATKCYRIAGGPGCNDTKPEATTMRPRRNLTRV